MITNGQGDGLSLFRLTAKGRLVHDHSLEDRTDLALDNVSALGAVAVEEGIAVLTTSATEAGLCFYRIDFSPGAVVAQGAGEVTGTGGDDLLSFTSGACRDLISDGPGQDTLSGGAGADIFLLRADGRCDVITDIRPGQDLLDLSLWPFL
ncbi:hypothetical protein [Aestuariicoccus sp. MJ-SS9]|uniref:hypothetical protein n=1 Tax=Aestuariicoccus sp. MJ-SS9 TaxID=3079855 RepID=UPI002912506A|nr:hypothetical protein [Aestuariicoccus sp. MJ-SS9]MDU8912145.1 hypothetical protein [Aestuariicoccus sp. MJ-SS9]